jgi:MFS family permease
MSQATPEAIAIDGAPESIPDSIGKPPPFRQQIRSFAAPFWAANVMELIERLAYYGVRVVVPIYIASSEDPGGLHFSNVQKAGILMPWAIVQTLLPMFSGGFADRYGRKSTISASILLKIAGYLIMASQRSFYGFLAGCMVLAAGTAIFKPGVQGTLVRGTTRDNSSLGWGIFYQVVNIGGMLGPPLAGALRGWGWKYVFLSCAVIVSLNFLVLLGYRDEPRAEQAAMNPAKVLGHSLRRLFQPRLMTFILVMSGFWVMFMQLFDALPNFIEEWTDSASVVAALGLSEGAIAHATPRGLQIAQEWMINLDATMIVFLMIPIALVTARFRRLDAIVVGIVIACTGLVLAGATMSGWLCLAGIAVFAIGEMVASPKMSEYLGVIAPKGEEALYMGFANVPLAIGWTSGLLFAGVYYDRVADKANLAVRYLREHALLDEAALANVARTDAMKTLETQLHLDARATTELLFSTYEPQRFWYPFVVVGLASAIGMILYARAAKRWGAENA